MTPAVPSGRKLILLSLLSKNEYNSLFTMSELSPTDLLNRLVFSNAGFLISQSEKFSKISFKAFSVEKILFAKLSLLYLLEIKSSMPVKELIFSMLAP